MQKWQKKDKSLKLHHDKNKNEEEEMIEKLKGYLQGEKVELVGKVELKKKGQIGMSNNISLATKILSQKRKTFIGFIGQLHKDKDHRQDLESKMTRRDFTPATIRSDVRNEQTENFTSGSRKFMRFNSFQHAVHSPGINPNIKVFEGNS
jgi:hypothetical protein